jgi:16S rRNA (cytosine1402-N4)-methyltransferase
MEPEAPKPPRRKRYAGTHPVRFDEKYKELQPEKYPEVQAHVRAQGRTPAGTHVPIMVAEVLATLAPQPGEIVADLTLGYGGHAAEFLKRISLGGRLIGLDLDRGQLERTGQRLVKMMEDMAANSGRHATPGHVTLDLRPGNFAGLDRTLAELALDGCDVIFADLGLSSMQIDDPARGFSYKVDGPLDMRMDPARRRTAADLLATLPEDELAAALSDLADEPDAAQIASLIVARRARRPIARTIELVELILEAKGLGSKPGCHGGRRLPPCFAGSHPAALTFQALRILVNNELSNLNQLLRIAPACLRPGGRIGLLSFHSGEDRLVKQSFRDGLRGGIYEAVSDELLRPGPAELRDNPRSNPARFRWAKKVPR